MRDIRKILAFSVNCLLQLSIALRNIPRLIYARGNSFVQSPLFDAAVAGVAAICGWAWWAIWKGKPSARAWGVAGSTAYVLVFLRQFAIPEQPVWDHHIGALTIGTVGLIAFILRYEQPYPSKVPAEPANQDSLGSNA